MQRVVIEGSQVVYITLTPEEEAAWLAQREQYQPTQAEINREQNIRQDPLDVKSWFAANPNALLIFSMPLSSLVTEIADLVDVSFPLLSAANRTRWKLLITTLVLVVRVLVRRERLD